MSLLTYWDQAGTKQWDRRHHWTRAPISAWLRVHFHFQRHVGRAAVRGVAERDNAGMFAEKLVDDLALYADAAAVDDADLAKAAAHGLIEILRHHDMDLLRLESMEVDGILDRDFVHGESI